MSSGGSRPSDKDGGGGGGVVGIPDPEKKAGGPGLPKKFFSPFGPHFARKIRGGGGGGRPPPNPHGTSKKK